MRKVSNVIYENLTKEFWCVCENLSTFQHLIMKYFTTKYFPPNILFIPKKVFFFFERGMNLCSLIHGAHKYIIK